MGLTCTAKRGPSRPIIRRLTGCRAVRAGAAQPRATRAVHCAREKDPFARAGCGTAPDGDGRRTDRHRQPPLLNHCAAVAHGRRGLRLLENPTLALPRPLRKRWTALLLVEMSSSGFGWPTRSSADPADLAPTWPTVLFCNSPGPGNRRRVRDGEARTFFGAVIESECGGNLKRVDLAAANPKKVEVRGVCRRAAGDDADVKRDVQNADPQAPLWTTRSRPQPENNGPFWDKGAK